MDENTRRIVFDAVNLLRIGLDGLERELGLAHPQRDRLAQWVRNIERRLAYLSAEVSESVDED